MLTDEREEFGGFDMFENYTINFTVIICKYIIICIIAFSFPIMSLKQLCVLMRILIYKKYRAYESSSSVWGNHGAQIYPKHGKYNFEVVFNDIYAHNVNLSS